MHFVGANEWRMSSDKCLLQSPRRSISGISSRGTFSPERRMRPPPPGEDVFSSDSGPRLMEPHFCVFLFPHMITRFHPEKSISKRYE